MSDDSHKRLAIGKFVSIQIRNPGLGFSVLRKTHHVYKSEYA